MLSSLRMLCSLIFSKFLNLDCIMQELAAISIVMWFYLGNGVAKLAFSSIIFAIYLFRADSKSPLCVHCSAGCGRTGVVIVIDYFRHLLKTEVGPP